MKNKNKLKTTTEPTLYKITINYVTDTEVTIEADENDEWSRVSTSSSHSIIDFSVTGKYGELEVNYEPNFEDYYYLLYYVYSTADSFGQDEHGSIEFVDLYKTKGEADKAKQLIIKHHEKYSSADSTNEVRITLSNGKPHDMYTPYHGYFESLSYVEVEAIKRSN